ncbi:30S ribosomal subunit protein S13 [Candidatus Xenohaliotis californiensis]|uniref:Small ribosomal subunit protein uS13 n=1 Tax=Candidatus Xenohaliotis californiensis TaxID=84677 RepID=A0ABP0ETB9_9RICK|nr:30S ribosomal subunit protein S13 [Candidatus Xenohaliotis californiensis]
MRIAGVTIPSAKKVRISLCYVYGIGSYKALQICKQAGIDAEKRVKDLLDDEVSRIIEATKNHTIEGDLRTSVMMNIRSLCAIGCYRGQRHKRGLPVRGQRTHTNAKTSKKLLKSFKK